MTAPNAAQIAEWNGEQGQRWVQLQQQMDRMIEPFGDAALQAAAPRPGERVLDIGCGCGSTTLALARAVGSSGQVLGVDVSQPMLAAAQRLAAAAPELSLRFVEADAATAALPHGQDLLFSRFGLMFFDQPAAALRHLRRALRPGGRCAFVCWRAPRDNPWAMAPLMAARKALGITPPPADPHAPGPFALADEQRLHGLLSEAGFGGIRHPPRRCAAARRQRCARRRRTQPAHRPGIQAGSRSRARAGAVAAAGHGAGAGISGGGRRLGAARRLDLGGDGAELMPPMIDIQGLGKTYASGLAALKNIDLQIGRGEIFALLGPNGAGKTTLISIVCGIVNASTGRVTVDGHDIRRDCRAARSTIGLVPQELSTDAFETVWNTVAFSRGLFGKPPNPPLLERLLKQLSLWDKKDARIMQLSGGMKRRVMIAKALSHEPQHAVPGRAHRRRGRGAAPRHVADGARPAAARRDHHPDHALHRRSRGDGRAHRRHQRAARSSWWRTRRG